MRSLAIETATTACAIALDDGEIVTERILDRERRHTEALTPGIAALLAERSLATRDLERIVVDHGPGLFTGLRVGLAAAQALARGLGVELVQVTSLEVLAAQAHARGLRGVLVALVDARRGELFTQCFELGESVLALDAPGVRRPEELASELAENLTRPFVTGDGAARYRELLAGHAEVLDDLVPSPAIALAVGAHREGVETASALYLREADAVARFATRAES